MPATIRSSPKPERTLDTRIFAEETTRPGVSNERVPGLDNPGHGSK